MAPGALINVTSVGWRTCPALLLVLADAATSFWKDSTMSSSFVPKEDEEERGGRVRRKEGELVFFI